jgi:hypothetical protein
MESILSPGNVYAQGLEHLMYSGFYDGTEGLQQRKKKALFEPAYFVTYEKQG